MIFTVNDGEVIVISDEEGGNASGEVSGNDINVEEWQSVFPNDDDSDETGADPSLIEGGFTRKDRKSVV